METVLFIIFGAVALVAAFGVILSRNPVYSALFLLLNFATLAVFYILLNAQFLAVAQVAVYAGAIVVLFLFVTMLIGGAVDVRPARNAPSFIAAVVLAVVLGIALLYSAVNGALAPVSGPATAEALAEIGNIQALGRVLYTRYILPFQLAAVLLLVGMIGAVVMARRTG